MGRAPVLMVQGTASSVGKTLLVTALCRLFARRGLRVAPFKAQNMSNNAGVCPDGSEISRAQYLQALACGATPRAEMNPLLLKPEGNARCQVVLLGRRWRSLPAGEYYRHIPHLWETVRRALDTLRAEYDLVVAEGAGSPAELNLRARDLANMAVARYAQAPVLLVGDIDRGGVFAQLLGTLALLPPAERRLVRGLVVNRFRGDPALFADGVRILEERSGVPVVGVLPYLEGLALPEEDAQPLERARPSPPTGAGLTLVGIRLPRLSNFDDFLPLLREPGVRMAWATAPAHLEGADAVLLPGTKATVPDMLWMWQNGLAGAVRRCAEAGVPVVGLCGGYQMLGRAIYDPEGVESDQPVAPGLGLLPVETVLTPEKATFQTEATVLGGPGWLAGLEGLRVQGYEIHAGRTRGGTPWLRLDRRNGTPTGGLPDGAVSPDGRIWGCYLHGLLDNTPLRRAWLRSLGWRAEAPTPAGLEADLDRLADAVEAHLDLKRIEGWLWET